MIVPRDEIEVAEVKADEIVKPGSRRAAADRIIEDLRSELRRPGASNPAPKRRNKTADPCEVDGYQACS